MIKTELLAAIAESKSQLSNQITTELRAIREESHGIREEMSGLREGLQILSETLLHPDEQKRVRKAIATG